MITFFVNSIFCKYNTINNTIDNTNNKHVCAYLGEHRVTKLKKRLYIL